MLEILQLIRKRQRGQPDCTALPFPAILSGDLDLLRTVTSIPKGDCSALIAAHRVNRGALFCALCHLHLVQLRLIGLEEKERQKGSRLACNL